jgi:hypothetical protein
MMFLVMLPRNPFSKNFGQLIEVFKTSQRIHRLIELNLVKIFFIGTPKMTKWCSVDSREHMVIDISNVGMAR